MAIKFSQFSESTTTSQVDFIVGYDGNQNVKISPSNFLAVLGDYLPLTGGTLTGNLLLTSGNITIPSFVEHYLDSGTLFGFPSNDSFTFSNNSYTSQFDYNYRKSNAFHIGSNTTGAGSLHIGPTISATDFTTHSTVDLALGDNRTLKFEGKKRSSGFYTYNEGVFTIDGNELIRANYYTSIFGSAYTSKLDGDYVYLGSSTQSTQVNVSGSALNNYATLSFFQNGIRLNQNTTANELDDYEEGTYNPTFYYFISPPSNLGTIGESDASYWSNASKYTKIGDTVIISINLQFGFGTTNWPSSGTIYLDNLPFTPISMLEVQGSWSSQNLDGTYSADLNGNLAGTSVYNTTKVGFTKSNSGSIGGSTHPDTFFYGDGTSQPNVQKLYGHIIYKTNS